MSERELVIKVVAMPGDLNPHGDMFGGWIVSQMDLAAYLYARRKTHSRIVTVAIQSLTFHKPVYSGDCITCYATTKKVGRTSLTTHIEVLVERVETNVEELVTEGDFVFVAIGEDRKPVPFATESV